MNTLMDLTSHEMSVLEMALRGPLPARDPALRQMCLDLQARRLLQRAGHASLANGWQGSPDDFVLGLEGWRRLKAERLPGAARRRWGGHSPGR